MMDWDKLKFEQYCHRQVKLSVQAWAKKSYAVDKMLTFKIKGKINESILLAKEKAKTVYRYDLENNDLDYSINEFHLALDDASVPQGKISKVPTLPLAMTFFSGDSAVIVHVISHELGFISAKSEEIIGKFLQDTVF